MALNVMNEYEKIIEDQLEKTLKFILYYKYNKQICDEFIEVYIENRYNGLAQNITGLTVKSQLLAGLKNKKEKLLEQIEDKTTQIEATYSVFYETTALEKLELDDDIVEKIKDIIKIKEEQLNDYFKSEDDKSDFIESLIEITEKYIQKKKEFIRKFATKEFNLKARGLGKNIQKIDLSYNIKFPMIYSSQAIEKAFDSGLVREDRVFVLYYLATIKVLNDLLESNYTRTYLVDFPAVMVIKKQKTARLLEIINNPSMQDRIILDINYSTLKKDKEYILSLISDGYKIALRIDKDFNWEDELEVQRLTLFKYVILESEEDNKKLSLPKENKILDY